MALNSLNEILAFAQNGHEKDEQSQRFLELILDTIPDVIFVKDANYRHVRGNPAFFNLFPEEMHDKLIGMTGTEEFEPHQVEAYQVKDREAFETGSSVATEKITVLGGETLTFHTTKTRFEDHEGNPFLLGIARNISEIVEAQESVQKALSFQNLMLDHIPDLVFVKDEDFRIVQANQNFLNVYPEEMRDSVIGSTTLEQYDEKEREAFLEQDRLAFAHGVTETEESIEFPDGTRRVLLTKKVRFEDPDAKTFVLGIGRDITELVEARRAREASRELLENVFDTVTGAVIGIDRDRQVLMINNAGRDMLAGEMGQVPFEWPSKITFLKPEDMSPLEASLDPVARALVGQRIDGEVHLMTAAGSHETRYVRVTTALVRNETSPLHSVIVLDDVSEAEQNRQHVERQSRLDALGQLTGGIAHDFNNLLNTLQYALALIAQEPLSERAERSMQAALRSIGRGSELTSRLLSFGKRQPARASAVPVNEVFDELKGLVLPAIEASVRVEFVEAPRDLLVFCDQGQLQNAALNLILNSRDAIVEEAKGHRITVAAREVDAMPLNIKGKNPQEAVFSTEQQADGAQSNHPAKREGRSQRFVEISISDNGPGMSKAVVSRALDPFFTTKGKSSGKCKSSGSGLGLSMVYGFVQQSHGALRIDTEKGHGTTVKLFLPFGNEVAGREEPVALGPAIEGKGETLLIVEDEPCLLAQMSELLRELNYTPIKAHSGREALAMIKEGVRFDLLLTDIVMPGGVGGFELARQAREIIPDVPIIYMSGYTGFTDEEMGDVIAPLLPKPSSASMTSATLRSVLDKSRRPAL